MINSMNNTTLDTTQINDISDSLLKICYSDKHKAKLYKDMLLGYLFFTGLDIPTIRVNKAIKELSIAYLNVSTSDLQGIALGLAHNMIKGIK